MRRRLPRGRLGGDFRDFGRALGCTYGVGVGAVRANREVSDMAVYRVRCLQSEAPMWQSSYLARSLINAHKGHTGRAQHERGPRGASQVRPLTCFSKKAPPRSFRVKGDLPRSPCFVRAWSSHMWGGLDENAHNMQVASPMGRDGAALKRRKDDRDDDARDRVAIDERDFKRLRINSSPGLAPPSSSISTIHHSRPATSRLACQHRRHTRVSRAHGLRHPWCLCQRTCLCSSSSSS